MAAAGLAPPATSATGAPVATGPAVVMEVNNSSTFYPLRALANIAGQKASTSFPLALITFESLSAYIMLMRLSWWLGSLLRFLIRHHVTREQHKRILIRHVLILIIGRDQREPFCTINYK